MRPANIVERLRRRRALVVLAVATALTATATAVAATTAVSPPQVLNYQAYVGGKGKAKANLSPVVLGWVNTQGGPPNATFPQVTDVARAAVRMVNGELGGVHGHPVKLSECFIVQAEEEGVRCGQQMVNEKGMKAIVLGAQFTRQPVDVRDGQGHDSRHRRCRDRSRGLHGEERLLPERQPDERARAIRHVHEAVPAEGEDGCRRLSEPAGRRHRRAPARQGHGEPRVQGDEDRPRRTQPTSWGRRHRPAPPT